jgi:hypothetical protein
MSSLAGLVPNIKPTLLTVSRHPPAVNIITLDDDDTLRTGRLCRRKYHSTYTCGSGSCGQALIPVLRPILKIEAHLRGIFTLNGSVPIR